MTASDEHHLLRFAGPALAGAVWVLGVVPPPRDGLTPGYLLSWTALLALLAMIDQTAPRAGAPLPRRLLWLAAELVVCWLVVRFHGTFVRPAFVYLVPIVRALLMFEGWAGLLLSLLVWTAYALNVWFYAWPDRLHEYPNYLSFFLAPYMVGTVLTLAMLQQARDRRHVEALYEQLRQAHDELTRLHARAREAAVTAERNRLAREIHDSLAHYLTVINVQLEAAEKLAPESAERALEQVRRARRLTLESLREVRRSVAALRAASLDELSLPRALDKLAGEFAESTGIAVHLDLGVPDDVRLAPETALTLYRAAQEGLTNVHRHARAANAYLTLRRENGRVELTVRDDGVGPGTTPAGEDAEGGFGLLGLRERVDLLGGCLAFEAAVGGGSRLTVALPVAGAAPTDVAPERTP